MCRHLLCVAILVVSALLDGRGIAQPAANDPYTYTDQSLLTALENLAYEPKVINKRAYEVSIQLGWFRSTFQVGLSTDRTALWFTAFSRKLARPEAIPPAIAMNLLARTQKFYPAHFSWDAKLVRVYIYDMEPNRDFTPALLKNRIEQFAALLKRTWPDWKYEALQPPEPAIDSKAAAQERQKILGKWSVESLEQDGVKKGADRFQGVSYLFADTACTLSGNDPLKMQFPLNPEAQPKECEFRVSVDYTERGIYQFENDNLILCLNTTGTERPKDFAAPKDSKNYVLVLKREK